MVFKLWRACLLKPGTHVLVDTAYGTDVAPRWESGTLAGVTQYGRVCRVLIDDKGHSPWAGTHNTHVSYRVQRAITRH